MTAAPATSPNRPAATRVLRMVASGLLALLVTIFSVMVVPAHAQKAQRGKSAPAKSTTSEAAATPAVGTITPTTSGPVQVAEISTIPIPAIAARAWI